MLPKLFRVYDFSTSSTIQHPPCTSAQHLPAHSVYVYTECTRKILTYFWRTFLMPVHIFITKLTCIGNLTVTEQMAQGKVFFLRFHLLYLFLTWCMHPCTAQVHPLTDSQAKSYVDQFMVGLHTQQLSLIQLTAWCCNNASCVSHSEYCNKHFAYVFCEDNTRADV